MNDTPRYTTRLQAGLGLVPETMKLLAVWQPGMSPQTLLHVALQSGEFPNVTARRLRNVVLEGFSPRYLVDDGAPARLLKATVGALPKEDLSALCLIFTCRANAILADFVRQVYWPRYTAGASTVTKRDALDFVAQAISEKRTTTHWSPSTMERVSSYLLGACADFEMLGPMKDNGRSIQTFRITPPVASVLAHDLHFRGLGDSALILHPDWLLFGLAPDDVVGELRRLSLQGKLIVQSAGGVTQISWKHRSMEEVAHDLTHC